MPDLEISVELQKIANCESWNRQFRNGKVLKGDKNKNDVGRFQINENLWDDIALSMGYDIYTFEGNTLMAKWIYNNYGLTPWGASEDCWMNDDGIPR